MKIRVGILFGGKSVEHEISIITALQAANSLDKTKYEIVPVYITKDNYMYTGENLLKMEMYKNIGKLISSCRRVILTKDSGSTALQFYPPKKLGNNIAGQIDVVLPIVHGTNSEDGTLQGFLEMLDVPYAGCGVIPSALGMDKYAMKAVLKMKNLPVLDCLCYNLDDYKKGLDNIISETEKAYEYPVIVKPSNLGSSIGISRAGDRDSLSDAIELAFSFSGRVIIEKCIENLKEINCSVLGDYEKAEASVCEEPVGGGEILSFSDKYMQGEKSKGMSALKRKLPADIPEEQSGLIKKYALDCFRALGCSGVCRIDFLIDNKSGEIFINEINTIPGSLSFYLWEATGISFSNLLNRLIDLAHKKHRENQNTVFTYESNILKNMSLGAKGTKSN